MSKSWRRDNDKFDRRARRNVRDQKRQSLVSERVTVPDNSQWRNVALRDVYESNEEHAA